MGRALIILNGPSDRRKAADWVEKAPTGTRLEFKASRRSLSQNKTMWLLLTDLATQLPWHGIRLTAQDYKLLMMSALKQEMRIVPNIDGTGFCNLGTSSSELSKGEMTALIELILCFGANHGVRFTIDRGEERTDG